MLKRLSRLAEALTREANTIETLLALTIVLVVVGLFLAHAIKN